MRTSNTVEHRPTQNQKKLQTTFQELFNSPGVAGALEFMGFSQSNITETIATLDTRTKNSSLLLSPSEKENKIAFAEAIDYVILHLRTKLASGTPVESVSDFWNKVQIEGADREIIHQYDTFIDVAAFTLGVKAGAIVTAEGAICGAILDTKCPQLQVLILATPNFFDYPVTPNLSFGFIFKTR